ncbi:MAG: addiction module toxin RelE [Chloroflexi bacterium]|nr:addiction module toxin RelE [Chloroflexota bacterium]
MVTEATNLTRLAKPCFNRLEALRGNRRGQYSMRINDQWRVCFKCARYGAMEIEVTDCH